MPVPKNLLTAMLPRILRVLLPSALAVLLSGCNWVVMSPSGDVAAQQRDLIVASTVLMLLIIVPVMALTAWFGWRYRAANTEARYEPEFHHSTGLELIIWSAPLLIIIALGALTWITTHTLDPFRPLTRITATQPVPAGVKPIHVQAVALDWKWLFIYPDYGVATVNQLAAPVDVPIDFEITSSTVMNAFFVPALAGMIYAMPAMDTRLYAVINRPGEYLGFSGNYSGAGFSDMNFKFLGLSQGDFDRWIQTAKTSTATLGAQDYLTLARPSEREPVKFYGNVAAGLYDKVVNLCVQPGKMCLRDMMAIDARGGLGLAGAYNIARLTYDRPAPAGGESSPRPAQPYVLALCNVAPEKTRLESPAALSPSSGLAPRVQGN